MIVLFYNIQVAILLTFLMCPLSYAFSVHLNPDVAIPGDIVVLKITGNEGASVRSPFLKNKVIFHPVDEDKLIALLPVDINTKPQKYDILIERGDETRTASLHIRSHSFKTIKLSVSEEKVTLSPEDQKRVEKEYLLQNRIWNQLTSRMWDGKFTKPVSTEISTEFGVRRIFNEKKNSVHRGTDFRGKKGTPVRAINSGTVVLADELFYGGNTVIVDHGMGLYSVYMHLFDFKTTKGDKVSKADIIGFIGSSGRATGPHLHLSVKLHGVSVNPLSLFKLEL